MKVTAEVFTLEALHGLFRIAREAHVRSDTVIVSIEHEGVTGVGEGKPVSYYDAQTAKNLVEVVTEAQPLLGDDPFLIEDIVARVTAKFPKAHAAICAIDTALHDLAGKLLGAPLYRLFGLDPARAPLTDFTIGIEAPAVMAKRAAAAAKEFRILKIKVGAGDDEEIIKAIRDLTDLPLRLDANTGWTKEQAVENINRLAKYNIEFVEQPIAPGDNEGLRFVRQRVSVPTMADESLVHVEDIPRLAGCVDAINIKLMKCRGIRQALKMIHLAHGLGMKVMLGCFSETSVGITAAAHLSPMVEYADLDGNRLVANDPFRGVSVVDGRLTLPDGPGLGVERRKQGVKHKK
ncbi:MAG: mandelate racemase/muconate lactonizing enzyme family protein [Phycisphaerae bacterium]